MPDTMDEEPGKDAGKDAPSLELPSLGWRRRRRRAEPTTEPTAEQPVEQPVEQPAVADPAVAEPTVVIEPVEPVEPVEPAAVVTAPLTAVPQVDAAPEPAPEPEPRPRRERGPGGLGAVVLTGVVVGLGIVGLTWASLRLCEEVQGTSSCGDTGYGLLIAILAAMIVVGALLLRLLRVPEPGSTSFLAVGLTAVLALLFLVDSLMDRPMVVVIPLLTAGTFVLAHWVTRTFAGPSVP